VRAIEDARAACADHRWGDAFRLLSSVELDALDIDDLDRLATASYLTGHDEDAFEYWVLAHERCIDDGAVHRAAYFGMRLGQGLGFKGDFARCRGWLDRTARLLDDARIDCVEQGYVEYGQAMLQLFEAGDVAGARAHFGQAAKIGAAYVNRDLVALGRIGEGRMLIYLGEITEGMALLDEAMASIEARELSPLVTGDAYCTVIDACAELFDLARCNAWTQSFTRWCDAQQELVLYRGHCFLHRAEMLELRGAWPEALVEARRACERLAAPVNPAALAGACMIEGDLLRLVGNFDGAETAYQRANEFGRDPQPSLALLRLAQGRIGVADAMIRRVVGETDDPMARARILGPCVEVMLAAGDTAAARTAADELHVLAAELATPYLRALATRARGAVLLADSNADAALVELRRAFKEFHTLGVLYDVARTRLLIADACEALGDNDTAAMERGTARSVLDSLGASSSLEPNSAPAATPPDGLTERELEVLILLARGQTNRGIGNELFISEKTVASHVSHIFTKLGVTSRSAATAYAYNHHLV
jgi:DNA-binding NarL/FixJ family response regulator